MNMMLSRVMRLACAAILILPCAQSFGQTFASATATVSGVEGTYLICNHGVNCYTHYDGGTVTVTVNGFTASASYVQGSTTATVAQALTNALNASGTPVTATLSGATITMTSLVAGPAGNYAISTGSTITEGGCSRNCHTTPDFTATLSGSNLAGAPVISTITPASGSVGTSITIQGSNLGPSQGSSTVSFNGTLATAISWSNTAVLVTVPNGASTGNVVVTINGVASNGLSFSVAPVITSLSLPEGPVQMGFVIYGSNFGASQGSVTLNGAPVPVINNSWSDGQITVQVPVGASNGNVVVTVDGIVSSVPNAQSYFTVRAPFECQP